jgi:predicted RNase H-like nuclease (RuvC/YqgF family)
MSEETTPQASGSFAKTFRESMDAWARRSAAYEWKHSERKAYERERSAIESRLEQLDCETKALQFERDALGSRLKGLQVEVMRLQRESIELESRYVASTLRQEDGNN